MSKKKLQEKLIIEAMQVGCYFTFTFLLKKHIPRILSQNSFKKLHESNIGEIAKCNVFSL